MSYNLPRDAKESARLEAQHRLYTDTTGYLLHPEILATLGTEARIADVYCATGVWLIKLAQKCPGTWHLQGFGVSSEQFPQNRGSVAPKNCDFSRTLDILQAIPKDLQGVFDVVHMRMLFSILRSMDAWKAVVENAIKLLKPGGWLQWCESDFGHMDVLRRDSAPTTTAMRRLHLLSFKLGMYDDRVHAVKGRLEILEAAGFECCQEDVTSSDRLVQTRSLGSQLTQDAVIAIGHSKIQKDPAARGTYADEWTDLSQEATAELHSGKAYWRWDIIEAIGRKRMHAV